MPDNESASIDKVMEAAWNETMGEALLETPDEMHHLGEPPKEPVEKQEEIVGAEEQPTGETQTAKEEDTQTTESVEAPKHWSETDRQTFAKLDKDGRDFLLRRHREMEADYTRKTQEHSETVKVGRQVSQYLDAGVRQDLQAAGMSDEQFIGSLLQYHRMSVVDPERFLRITAENLGLDPAKVFGVQQAPAQAAPTDPVATRLSAVEQRLQREDTQRLQKMQQDASTSITEFSSAKDSSGAPLRPHFDKVRATMGKLMVADPTLDLQQAYEVAVYRDPELRKEIIAQPPQPAAPAKIDDRKVKEAEVAIAAKRSNIRSNAAVAPDAQKPGGMKVSLRDAISSAADEVGFAR